MQRHRSTPEDKVALVAFLKRHSGVHRYGRQHDCGRRVRRMTDQDLLTAISEETNVQASRFWVLNLCQELGIPRRGRTGPPALSTSERKRRHRARRLRWLARLQRDPAVYERFLARRRAQWRDYAARRAAATA